MKYEFVKINDDSIIYCDECCHKFDGGKYVMIDKKTRRLELEPDGKFPKDKFRARVLCEGCILLVEFTENDRC